VTPYELVFGEGGFEERVFPHIHAEAESQAEDPRGATASASFRGGGRAAGHGAGRGDGGDPGGVPPPLLPRLQLLALRRRLYVLEPATARYLVEAAPRMSGWELKLPYPSVYVQLPPRLFWASIAIDAPPEPVDGFFAIQSQGIDPLGPGFSDLQVLMVLGVRRERAGFSVIPFDTEVGPGIPTDWAEAPGREGAPDFANILPGGEIAGLYSILTNTEALKLLAAPSGTSTRRRARSRRDRAGAARRWPGEHPPVRLPFQPVRLADAG
jgi:hypothetical protein